MTTKKLSSLKDFQDENLNVISKMQMATVVGGDDTATHHDTATLSSWNCNDNLRYSFRDSNGKETFYNSECIDELGKVLEPGEYKTL